MTFIDYFRMAFKNLSRQKSRTFLTIIAITVGSLSLILMASIIISIRQSLVDQFAKLGAFNLVTVVKDPNSINTNSLLSGSNGDPGEGKLIDNQTLVSLRAINHVVDLTPTIMSNIGTMHLENDAKKSWANILGYNPESQVFDIPLVAGRKLTNSDMDKIIIGSRLVQDTSYASHPKDLIGKNVVLQMKTGWDSAPDWGSLPDKPDTSGNKPTNNEKAIEILAEIIGVSDNGALDDGQNYINIAWAKRLNTNIHWEGDQGDKVIKGQTDIVLASPSPSIGLSVSPSSSPNPGPSVTINPSPSLDKNSSTNPDVNSQNNNQNMLTNWRLVRDDSFTRMGYSSVVLKVDDTKNISIVAEDVKKLGYGANTAQNMLDQINRILSIIGIVLAVIGGISLFVAAIGIINTMIMASYERIREIGVMRACGATRATIRHLFTFEAALLGFWGGVFGIGISLILGQVAKYLVNHNGANMGNLPVDKIGSFPLWLVLGVLAFTTFLGLVSGLGPAIKAARLNPVDALRYE